MTDKDVQYQKDFAKALKNLQDTLQPSEEIVYAFGTTEIPNDTLIADIKAQDGFIGVHPIDLLHTLLVFDSLYHANLALTSLKAKDYKVGKTMPIAIPKECRYGR